MLLIPQVLAGTGVAAGVGADLVSADRRGRAVSTVPSSAPISSPLAVKRQAFEAFGLRIQFDKAER